MVTKTNNTFILELKKVHGDKYDYSKVNYVNNHTKVCVICHEKNENGVEHGEFWVTPRHLLNGQGCKQCFKLKQAKRKTLTIEQFIEKAKKVHGDKYDYSKVNYLGYRKKICVICPLHGEFWQTAGEHLKGSGCKECAKSKMSKTLTTEQFVEKAIKKHNNNYDYSQVKYINAKTVVKIICKKHGEFWQTPSNHLLGCGCPTCSKSKMVIDLVDFFYKNNIKVEQEKKFDWLKINNNLLRLDIYLPEYATAIECQGIQHFKNIEYWGGEESFNKRLEYDKTKQILCEKHNIKLLYYSNLNIEFPYFIYKNKEEILNNIKHE